MRASKLRSLMFPAAALAVLVLVVGGCGGGDAALKAHPVTVPDGWTQHSFADMSIAVPADWDVVNQEETQACVNHIGGSLLEFGNVTQPCTSELVEQTDGNYVRVHVTKQPSAPVLTTVVGQSASSEPVNGYEAQHTHTPTSERAYEDIYVPALKISITVNSPKDSDLARQVLSTVTAE